MFSLRFQLSGISLCLELEFQGPVVFTALHVDFQLLCKIVIVHIQAVHSCTVCICSCQVDRNVLGVVTRHVPGVVPRNVPGIVWIMFRGLCRKFVVVVGGGWCVNLFKCSASSKLNNFVTS